MEGADNAGEHGGNHGCPYFHFGGCDTHRLGSVFALADGDQVMAHARFSYKPRSPHNYYKNEKCDVDVVDFFTENNPGQPMFNGRLPPLESSEERRVGKECVSTCRSRRSPNH